MTRFAPPSQYDVIGSLRDWRLRYYGATPHNDYNAAKPNRHRRRRTGLGGTGDAHYQTSGDLDNPREYTRDMDRNDPIVGPICDRAVINQLQTGFRLEPDTGDKALNNELRTRFAEWAGNPRKCDHHWEHTFWQLCWYALRQTYIDGDIFGLLSDDGSIQLLEADRCRTPKNTRQNVVHGILLDGRRKIQYWFTKDPGMQRVQRVSDIDKRDAYDGDGNPLVLHVYNPQTIRRKTQTRGVTAFAPVFDRLAMFEDIQFAKLVQQQIVSAIAWFIQRNDAYTGGKTTLGSLVNTNDDGSNTDAIEKIAAGLIVRGKPGEDMKAISGNVPNPEYFQHVKLILTEIGINIGLPLVMVLMDASETNFSGWRGAVDMARQGFRVNQKWFEERFIRPVYLWQVRRWLALPPNRGGLGEAARSNKHIFSHHWGRPSWPYINPKEDAEADKIKADNLQASPSMLQSERGRDWIDVVEEAVRDNSLAITRALEEVEKIRNQFPDADVNWRELLTLFANNKLPASSPSSSNGRDADQQQRGGEDDDAQ